MLLVRTTVSPPMVLLTRESRTGSDERLGMLGGKAISWQQPVQSQPYWLCDWTHDSMGNTSAHVIAPRPVLHGLLQLSGEDGGGGVLGG